MTIPGYDAWRLAGPREEYTIGKAVDEDCLRLPEPDEDQPRRFKPKPCMGMMIWDHKAEAIRCGYSGEIAT